MQKQHKATMQKQTTQKRKYTNPNKHVHRGNTTNKNSKEKNNNEEQQQV